MEIFLEASARRLREFVESKTPTGSEEDESDSTSEKSSAFECVDAPATLSTALREYWKAVMQAEATADELARNDDDSATAKFHYFTQLTPELEFVVPNSPGRLVTAMQTPALIEGDGNSPGSEEAVSVQCPSPEVETVGGGKSLSLEWTEETFLPDGRRWRSEKLKDDEEIRSRKCVYLDRMKESPVPRKLAGLTFVMRHGEPRATVEINQKTKTPVLVAANSSPDSILRRSNCPICYRAFRGSRSLAGSEEAHRIAVPKCGHILCLECAQHLSRAGTTKCPTCRAPWKSFYHLSFDNQLRRKRKL